MGGLSFPCSLGRSGKKVFKREGDGATPIGFFSFEQVYYRRDHLFPPLTSLSLRPIRRKDGWCDTVGDRNYNRLIEHPYPCSAEALWRKDDLYDIIIVLSYNRCPRIKGRGSAIFMHIVRSGYLPTEGCIALKKSHLLLLLHKMGRKDLIVVR
ncbi:MAG: L,D-transpeptidase [Hyphomicrobium sp.]